jgi:hypothetical protein
LIKVRQPVVDQADNSDPEVLRMMLPHLLNKQPMIDLLQKIWGEVGGEFAFDTDRKINGGKKAAKKSLSEHQANMRVYHAQRSLLKAQKILTTEEEFRIEAYIMKNCLSKQFSYGSFYIYISLKNINKKKRINVQFRKGTVNQQYGKANSNVPELFIKPVEILTNRIRKYPKLEWDKIKYDFIPPENE